MDSPSVPMSISSPALIPTTLILPPLPPDSISITSVSKTDHTLPDPIINSNVSDDGTKKLLYDLDVTVPYTVMAWEENYMEYVIEIVTRQMRWTVRRRYTQMRHFYKLIKQEYDQLNQIAPFSLASYSPPPLPTFPCERETPQHCLPYWWERHTTDPTYVGNRQTQFQKLLRYLTRPEFEQTLGCSRILQDFLEVQLHLRQ